MLDFVKTEDGLGSACMRRPLPLRTIFGEGASDYPHIQVCRDWATLKQIGRLRHQQYIQRQGKRYTSAVKERDCLIEDADFSSVNLFAMNAGQVTSAMRVGVLSGLAEPQGSRLRTVADRLAIKPTISLICARLVRDPRHSGRHAAHLIDYVRLKTVVGGYRYCLMQTAESLMRFFEKFEFFDTGIWSEDQIAGHLKVLVLDTHMRPRRQLD